MFDLKGTKSISASSTIIVTTHHFLSSVLFPFACPQGFFFQITFLVLLFPIHPLHSAIWISSLLLNGKSLLKSLQYLLQNPMNIFRFFPSLTGGFFLLVASLGFIHIIPLDCLVSLWSFLISTGGRAANVQRRTCWAASGYQRHRCSYTVSGLQQNAHLDACHSPLQRCNSLHTFEKDSLRYQWVSLP